MVEADRDADVTMFEHELPGISAGRFGGAKIYYSPSLLRRKASQVTGKT